MKSLLEMYDKLPITSQSGAASKETVEKTTRNCHSCEWRQKLNVMSLWAALGEGKAVMHFETVSKIL